MNMIFHLSAAGTPANWNVTAVYKDCLGIATAAADCWYNKQPEKHKTTPQCVIQIKDGECKHNRIWIHGSQMMKQRPLPEKHFINFGTSPFEVPEEIQDIVFKSLKSILFNRGYFISQLEWEIRYPGAHLFNQRFIEFNNACDEWKTSGSEGPMPYDPKWAPFMEKPEAYPYQYASMNLSQDGWVICERVTDTQFRHIESPVSKDIAENRCLLYNSGWDKDQVDILMREEPIYK